MREKRVIAPDGHAWHVRRRWAKRQLPWKRRAGHELFGPLIGLFSVDAEVGIVVVLALLALAALGVFALAGLVRDWVVPFLVANIGWIGATLRRSRSWWSSTG